MPPETGKFCDVYSALPRRWRRSTLEVRINWSGMNARCLNAATRSDEACFAVRRRAHSVSAARRRLATLLLISLLGGAGCRSFSQRGPVPEAVATCRQLSQQGVVAIEQGQWQQAELLLAQAVATCDTNVEARQHYAEALWKRGATQEAMDQLEAALKLAGDNAALLCRLGEMHLAQGNAPQALSMAGAALQHDATLPRAWALRGRAQQAGGNHAAALADLQRSLHYAPHDTQTLLAVAELQRQMNHPQRALVTLQQLADQYAPGEEPQQVLYLTGLALSALGRHAEAATQLYAACQRGAPSAELLYRLAEAEMLSGRNDAAEANAQQALRIDPQHVGCHLLVERLAAARMSRMARRQPSEQGQQPEIR